jgi:hypothetical protein
MQYEVSVRLGNFQTGAPAISSALLKQTYDEETRIL